MQIFFKTKLVRIIKAHLLDVVLGLYDIHKQSYSVNLIKDNWPITGWLLNKKFQFFTKWVLHISANILSEFKYDRSNTKADFTSWGIAWKCNAPGGCYASRWTLLKCRYLTIGLHKRHRIFTTVILLLHWIMYTENWIFDFENVSSPLTEMCRVKIACAPFAFPIPTSVTDNGTRYQLPWSMFVPSW